MRAPYRKSFEVVGATFHAELYCVECAESLPDVDPEGNEKHPVFVDDLDSLQGYSCGECHSYCSDW